MSGKLISGEWAGRSGITLFPICWLWVWLSEHAFALWSGVLGVFCGLCLAGALCRRRWFFLPSALAGLIALGTVFLVWGATARSAGPDPLLAWVNGSRPKEFLLRVRKRSTASHSVIPLPSPHSTLPLNMPALPGRYRMPLAVSVALLAIAFCHARHHVHVVLAQPSTYETLVIHKCGLLMIGGVLWAEYEIGRWSGRRHRRGERHRHKGRRTREAPSTRKA